MLSDEQLALRRTMVTASDTYALAGEGYDGQCSLSVYADKVAPAVRPPPTVVQRMGNLLEPLCVELLAEEKGLTIDTRSLTERHAIFPWLGATTDGRVTENGKVVAVVEAKAVIQWGGRVKWQGDLPADRVVIQATIQMLVNRVRKAYIPALICGDFRIYELELDDRNLGPALLEIDQQFWEGHVLPRIPPAPDASEASGRALRQLYPKVKGGIIAASDALEVAARSYFDGTAQAALADTRRQAAKNAIMAAIGEHGGMAGEGWKATWNETKTGRRLLIKEISE